MSEILEFAKDLARRAGKHAMERRKMLGSTEVMYKGDNPTDLVTVVDRETEDLIVRAIGEFRPGDGIFGEETGKSHMDARAVWTIDPIDGTTNFVHDYPFYSVSIGFSVDGVREVGVVYCPRLDELFWAERGGGAWLNGERLRVSRETNFQLALLATGFACVRARMRPDNLDRLPTIFRASQEVRRSGSAAMDLCYVAAGRLEGYWESCLGAYDVAAGALVVTEAGGTVTDYVGGGEFPEKGVAATNGLLHEKLPSFLK